MSFPSIQWDLPSWEGCSFVENEDGVVEVRRPDGTLVAIMNKVDFEGLQKYAEATDADE